MIRIVLAPALALTVALHVGACAGGSGNSGGVRTSSISINDVPAPVRATIEQYLEGGSLRRIQRSTEDSSAAYTVFVNGRESDFAFMVAQDGTYLGLVSQEDLVNPNDLDDRSNDQDDQYHIDMDEF